MRKSLQDIAHMVQRRPYPCVIPEELRTYHYYLLDCGHVIMCVLKCHLEKAKAEGMDYYELGVPVRYVLEKGYQLQDGYVIVDAPYSMDIGLDVEDEYYE